MLHALGDFVVSDHRLARARQLLAADHAAEAEQIARDLIAADPHSVDALAVLAEALVSQDRLDEGAAAARAALALEPENLSMGITLCEALVGASRSHEARPIAAGLVQSSPHSWATHYTLARTHLGDPMPQPRRALASALEANRLAPWSADPLNLAGICHRAMGEEIMARHAFEAALGVDPHHAHALTNLASLDVSEGRIRRGGKRLTLAMGAAPNSEQLQKHFSRIVSRISLWFYGVALGGLFLVFFTTFKPWWVHASLATAVACILGVLGWQCLRVLPRGPRNWWPVVWKHAPWVTRLTLVVGVLLTVALLGYGFAPSTPPPPPDPGEASASTSPGFPSAEVLVNVFGWAVIIALRVLWSRGRREQRFRDADRPPPQPSRRIRRGR
jgi:hypothetical protein